MSIAEDRAGQLVWLWLTVTVIALDQWSKALIESHLPLFSVRVLLPVLNLTRLHNPGAAFNFLADAPGWQRWVLIALAVTVCTALVVWLQRLSRDANVLGAGLALVLGGAAGNVIDRARFGYVVDFIQAHWQQHYFPSFNVADSSITLGAGLLLLDAWFSRSAAGAASR
ncbi:MAG TPA: signal peptidase II [Steroidobacteraceae bacterium]